VPPKSSTGKSTDAEKVVLGLLASISTPASIRDLQQAAFRVGRKSPAVPAMRRMSRTDYFLALHHLKTRGDVLQDSRGARLSKTGRRRAEALRDKLFLDEEKLAALR
jgi:hypothetical protein